MMEEAEKPDFEQDQERFRQITELISLCEVFADHQWLSELYCEAMNISLRIRPQDYQELFAKLIKELTDSGEYEVAYGFLHNASKEVEGQDILFHYESHLGSFCSLLKSPKALEHFSRAEELITSRQYPDIVLSIIHGGFSSSRRGWGF